jgi:hypothetical protein
LNKGKDVSACGRGKSRGGRRGDKNEIISGIISGIILGIILGIISEKATHLVCNNTELYQDACGLSRGEHIIYADRAVFKSRGNHHNVKIQT